MTLELAAADLDLGADGVAIHLHEGQKAMRGAAGDDLELARLEETAKTMDEVVAVLAHEDMLGPLEAVVVHVGQVMDLWLPARPLDLLAGQCDQVVEVAQVAV